MIKEGSNVPARTAKPRTPQYLAGMLTNDVRIDMAASVKKKFQCCPYSVTWTFTHSLEQQGLEFVKR